MILPKNVCKTHGRRLFGCYLCGALSLLFYHKHCLYVAILHFRWGYNIRNKFFKCCTLRGMLYSLHRWNSLPICSRTVLLIAKPQFLIIWDRFYFHWKDLYIKYALDRPSRVQWGAAWTISYCMSEKDALFLKLSESFKSSNSKSWNS